MKSVNKLSSNRSLRQSRMPRSSGRTTFRNITALGPKGETLRDAELTVEGGRIVSLSHGNDRSPTNKNSVSPDDIDAQGYAVIPGMFNAHTHAALSFFRDMAHISGPMKSDENSSMIERYLFPAEKHLDENLVEALSYSFFADAIKSGTTSVADHYYFSKGVGKAAQALGLRAYIGETICDLGGAFPTKDTYTRAKKLLEEWPFDSALVRPFVAPHAADTLSEAMLKACSELAHHHKLPIHMHLAQTKGEFSRVKASHDCSPVELASRMGLINERSLLVHMLEVSKNDLKLVADKGAAIGFCPSSQILYQNVAPISDFMAHQIPILVGTDCAASCDGADMIEELRIAALIYKDRTANTLSPQELFRWGSTNAKKFFAPVEFSSQAMGLAVGDAADLVFLKRSLASEPMHDLAVNTIYSGGSRRVEHVMINGSWVLWNQQLTKVNEEDLEISLQQATSKLYQKIRAK